VRAGYIKYHLRASPTREVRAQWTRSKGRTIARAAIFGEGFARGIADVHDPTKSLL